MDINQAIKINKDLTPKWEREDLIKKLKLAAEFLGNLPENIEVIKGEVWFLNVNANMVLFNPHEKEGRHWLVDILRKFVEDKKWFSFYKKMRKLIPSELEISVACWIAIAPSEICFNCIFEILEETT